jgi:hypothetical protein
MLLQRAVYIPGLVDKMCAKLLLQAVVMSGCSNLLLVYENGIKLLLVVAHAPALLPPKGRQMQGH